MITVEVVFANSAYNYATSVNGACTNEEIRDYFVGQTLNLGRTGDNLQRCIDVIIIR